jgi:prophage regulatory protein
MTQILRKPELFSKLRLSDATIWRLEKKGKFPQRIRLGGNSVGWFENEIDEWLLKKSTDRLESGNSIISKCHATK